MTFTRRETLRLAAAGAAAVVLPKVTIVSGQTTRAHAMLTKPIPATGQVLPVIGMGTWQTFDVADDATAALEPVLAAFVELGGTLVDSSPMYGRSEQVLGDLAAKLGVRDRLFVATKVWTRGRQAGIDQMNDSMKKLRADPIELMQVHNLLDVDAHLDTLRGWKRDGRVKHVGVTHYTASAHEAVAKIVEAGGIDFVQINYSVAEREAEDRLLPLAKDRGVAVIANRPLVGGTLLRKLKDRPLPEWSEEIACKSWAQLLLKFVVSHPAITCAIPATSKVEHQRDNMAAGMGVMPDEAQRKRIVEAALS